MRRTGMALSVLAVLASILVPCAARADIFEEIEEAFKKLDRLTGKLFDGLQMSGRGDFTLQKDLTSGSRQAYQSSYWNTDPFEAVTSFDVGGPIWGHFGLMAHIANSGYGYDDNRFMLGYQDRNTAVLWGDLSINLSGNEFCSFTKSLSGWQADQRVGNNVLVRTFLSKEKGLVRRQTFPGNNTSGPYFLTYTPVVEGSELVKVDELPQRLGEDYTLDYDTGQLYFEPPGQPPRIVPSTSIIAVSYQSATQYDTGGSTQGAQIETVLLKNRLNMVATVLQRTTPGGGAQDTAKYQEDIFQGSGSTGPFDTRYSPILIDGTRAVINGQQVIIRDALVVLQDGVEQQEGTDFDAIRSIGRILFQHMVPPTALVKIQYYYQLGGGGADTGGGTVYGLALQHKINKAVSWDLSAAESQAPGSGAGGLALSTGAQYSPTKAFNVAVRYHSMDPTFRYVDTVGFLRNETGLEASLGWRPNSHLTLSHQFSDVKTDTGWGFGYSGYPGGAGYPGQYSSDRTLQTGDDGSGSAMNIRALQFNTNLNVTYPGWPNLTLSHQLMGNHGGSGGDSQYNNVNLGLDYSPKKLPMTFRTSVSNSTQDHAGTPGADPTDPYASAQSANTTTCSVAYSWTPSERLAFATNFSFNDAQGSNTSQRGNSNSLQVSARWSPTQRINLSFDVNRTSSLGAVTSGFYGGGGGYYGGYSATSALSPTLGDSPADDDIQMSRYEDSSARLSLSWQPTRTLSLDGTCGLRKYTSGGSVGYLADSSERSGTLSASWLPTESLSVNASLGSDLLQFLDPGRGGVLNNSLTLSTNYRPPKSRFMYGLNLNRQWGVSPDSSGYGSTDTTRLVGTSLWDVSANLEYALAKRMRLVGQLGFSDFAGGFSNFVKETTQLAFQYDLNNSFTLNLGWQFINNNTRLPQGGGTTPGYDLGTGDYTTNLFQVSLSTNFQSSVGHLDRRTGSMNPPITPGYGGMSGQFGGGGYGGGFGSFGGFGGGFTGGLSSPGVPGGFTGGFPGGSGSYGGYGSFGGFGSTGGFGGFGGTGGLGGSSGYYSPGGSFGSGFGSQYPTSGSQFPGSYGQYGGSGGFGGMGTGGYGSETSSGTPWGPGGSAGSLWGSGAGPTGPTPQELLGSPLVGDPWGQGCAGLPEFPIDDMRDI